MTNRISIEDLLYVNDIVDMSINHANSREYFIISPGVGAPIGNRIEVNPNRAWIRRGDMGKIHELDYFTDAGKSYKYTADNIMVMTGEPVFMATEKNKGPFAKIKWLQWTQRLCSKYRHSFINMRNGNILHDVTNSEFVIDPEPEKDSFKSRPKWSDKGTIENTDVLHIQKHLCEKGYNYKVFSNCIVGTDANKLTVGYYGLYDEQVQEIEAQKDNELSHEQNAFLVEQMETLAVSEYVYALSVMMMWERKFNDVKKIKDANPLMVENYRNNLRQAQNLYNQMCSVVKFR